MCGIAGVLQKSDYSTIGLIACITAMNRVMIHRGPDDEGSFVSTDKRVGFGNRRLSILDLSPAGHMPMADESESVWITYNGEVYNADTLRDELEALGYHFRSTSDTEVILKGYMQWGKSIVAKLRGMFAFAIYDGRQNQDHPQVLLARDHLGVKPLYYAETTSHFIFGSELKVILASGLMSKEVSPDGLMGYLLTGSVPNPLTIYRDIKALEPAHLMQINLANGQVERESYWQLPTEIDASISAHDAVEQTRALLEEAVKIRLVSDVPLGAFLSGGLDSSAVVGLMRQATTGEIRTCSMVFEESKYSEASYAKAMADHVGATHYERVITASAVLSEFDNILSSMDQPSNDGINTYFVSQTARQAGLTVALSGLGGDELFGGYPNTFRQVPTIYNALRTLQSVPMLMGVAKLAIKTRSHHQSWRLLASALDRPASMSSAYWSRRGFFTLEEARNLVNKEFLGEFDPVSYATKLSGTANGTPDHFAWVSRTELRTYTHNQLLRDTDAMSMAHSLEVRVPLLDYKLVEYVLRLPSHLKQGEGIKPLLLQSVKDLLPAAVTDRRDKQGFVFPMDIWMRGILRDATSTALAAIKNQRWISHDAVDKIFQEFTKGNLSWTRLWSLVALTSMHL